jgi:four helix bundle protein
MVTNRPYDLEERTLLFAREVRGFVRGLPDGRGMAEDISQLVRSSGSVGANYIESREGLSKKESLMRLRIARKEAKESRYWLRLLAVPSDMTEQLDNLVHESTELLSILSAIIEKLQPKKPNAQNGEALDS